MVNAYLYINTGNCCMGLGFRKFPSRPIVGDWIVGEEHPSFQTLEVYKCKWIISNTVGNKITTVPTYEMEVYTKVIE